MTDAPHPFELIKQKYFIDPAPEDPAAYIGKVQAELSVLIGNMLEWYVRGAGYTGLAKALQFQLEALRQTTVALARSFEGQRSDRPPDDKSPFVVAENWTLDNIELPFAQEEKFDDLVKALPIVDTDTGGTIRFNHHFIGELHPQGNVVALAASMMATFLNENVVIPKVSPSVTFWEKAVVGWVWEMLGRAGREGGGGAGIQAARADAEDVPDTEKPSGRIVAGGTVANLTAMFIARERFREWRSQAGGAHAGVSPVLLYSGQSHYSIRKAARIVGFVENKNPALSEIVRIDGRNYWYITAEDVAQAIQAANARGQCVVMVSALAGATDTGFVDDLDGIAAVIAEYNSSPLRVGPKIYYHIDAAMGGPFCLLDTLDWKSQQEGFTPTRAQMAGRPERGGETRLFKGIGRGDAVTIDGHKYFYCNYPCGGIFVRSESDFDCLYEDARYLESGESEATEPEELTEIYTKLGLTESPMRDLEKEWLDRRGLRTLEGSRSVIGITQLYCTLKVFGPNGLGALLQHTLDMTVVLRELIRQTRGDKTRPALELITSGPLNQTLFRVVTRWDSRTEPEQIKLDNKINYLLPYYANWVQTGKLKEKLDGSDVRPDVKELIGTLRPFPFYVGTDQLLAGLPDDERERDKRVGEFLDYVWRINGEKDGCPKKDKLKVRRWLRAANAPQTLRDERARGLPVLKAVITHPYTDKAVLERYVNAIRDGAEFLRGVLEKNGKQADRSGGKGSRP